MSQMQEGLIITVNGMLIVFAVLILIMFVLMAMRLFHKAKTKGEEALPSMEKPAETAAKNADPSIQDDELIAVLTAAVYASLGTSTYRLQIKSYRKITNQSPVWNAMSRRENIQNKL